MLKYNIKKRKYWVYPFFGDNLNSGAYIVSKDSIGFLRWCITHRITGFSDFIHRPDSN
jgi:hypothetical protein